MNLQVVAVRKKSCPQRRFIRLSGLGEKNVVLSRRAERK